MNVQLLVCLRCGGPLGKVETVPAIVECEFCNAVISVGHGLPVVTRESTHDAARDAQRKAARTAFIAAVNEMAAQGRDPFEALCEAAARHLGAAGQTQTLARITFALAVDFEAETRASIRRDGIAMCRIAESYLLGLDELRTAHTYDLNLPFLTADSTGPKHMRRALTPALLAELAQREPGVVPHVEVPVVAEAAPPVKKKRSWWPF